MKRAIEIRSRVCHHLDLPDMKLGPGRVTCRRIFATEKIADHRRRQTFVSDHSMLDRVTYINQLKLTRHPRLSSSNLAADNTDKIRDFYSASSAAKHVVAPAPENSTPYHPAGSSPALR